MKIDKIKFQLGIRIKEIRKKKGLTQELLAEMVGINAKYLSNIERGRENPTLNILVKISQSLNTQLYEIFDISEQIGSKENKIKIDNLVKSADPDQIRIILKILSTIIN